MDKNTYFQQLEERSRKIVEFWKLAKHTTLLLLAVVVFLLYFLLGKLEEALQVLG